MLPPGWVVENVITDCVQFFSVADDVVVVFALPAKIRCVAATMKVIADNGLECSHHFGEGLIAICRGAVSPFF